MLRNILVICGGIILGLLLMAFSGWFLYQFSGIAKIPGTTVAAQTARAYKLMGSMERGFRIIEYGIFPLGAILIGAYVGFASVKNESLISALTGFSFIAQVASFSNSRMTGFAFSLWYLSFCCFTTYFISKWKERRRLKNCVRASG